MFYRQTVLALGISLVWAGTALATGSETVSPEAQTAKKDTAAGPDTSRRVCREIVIAGTRLSSRQCKTQKDWDSDAEKAGRYVQDELREQPRGVGHGFGTSTPPASGN